jgi:nucleotide-binding universal stress UspA family protein
MGTNDHPQPALCEIPLTPIAGGVDADESRHQRAGRTLHGGIWTFVPMVRWGAGRDDPVMTSTDHIDRSPSADRDGRLLICYDGSAHAKHAIRHAARLLSAKDALVVTVWQPTAILGGLAWAGEASMVNMVDLDRAVAEDAGRVADDGVRIALEAGLAAEPMAVEADGPVWKVITEAADRNDAAVIVMGSRGLTGLRSMLLGSVSGAVVHHADRPVLVVDIPCDGDGQVIEADGAGRPASLPRAYRRHAR